MTDRQTYYDKSPSERDTRTGAHVLRGSGNGKQ